jgi:F0F1-type ATP synthase epsilon subunit
VRVKTGDGEETAFDVEAGFVSVTEHGVTVLAETAVPAQGPDPAAEAATNPGTGTAGAPRPDVL